MHHRSELFRRAVLEGGGVDFFGGGGHVFVIRYGLARERPGLDILTRSTRQLAAKIVVAQEFFAE
ncbi:hypothetical protein [Massilia timonae]|uniref:hypothetical protein n=1 Tax=Massilia timonae TaxID=47229 RepID=UPI0028996333|nr:hypothetical protein [Massilia timonae]